MRDRFSSKREVTPGDGRRNLPVVGLTGSQGRRRAACPNCRSLSVIEVRFGRGAPAMKVRAGDVCDYYMLALA